MADQGGIHDEHPFRDAPPDRDPVRRFRGRLTAPVTVVTAGSGFERSGLTVASVMVAEGDPAIVYLLVGPTTDLYLAIEETRRFVVHIGAQHHRELSDVFAAIRPSPGGLFAGVDVVDGDYGPELTGFENRLRASVVALEEASFSVLVAGAVESIELGESDEPLVWYRGSYRSLS